MSNKKLCNINSVKEIMQEMGFNKNAPLDTQKAFLKHLLNQYTDYKFIENNPKSRKNISLNNKSKNSKDKKVQEFEQLDLFKKAS